MNYLKGARSGGGGGGGGGGSMWAGGHCQRALAVCLGSGFGSPSAAGSDARRPYKWDPETRELAKSREPEQVGTPNTASRKRAVSRNAKKSI